MPVKILSQIRETWNKLPRGARLAVGSAGVVTVGAVLVLAVLSSRGPAYDPLFTGLDPRDAAEIVSRLDKEKVPYRLEAGGTAILVPSTSVHRMRLLLSSEGLPRGGVVGFELIDQSSRIGATDFDRRLNYVRALQGELARTIMQISGVEAARVHIALPEESLFVTRTRPPTAAVLIKMRPMAELDKSQVKGIINLVARSVEGLKPQDVTLIDYTGRILSYAQDSSNGNAEAGSLLEVRAAFQKELEQSVQSLLERVLGPGNVVARVSAELNLDQTTITRSLFTPVSENEGIVRSIKQLTEVFQGTGTAAGGVPGVPSNVPGYQGAAAGGQTSSWQKTETTRAMEINETREQTVVAPGTVKRLSVGIIVNRDLTPAEKAAIESTVAAAIGFDPKRQDTITVTGMKFDSSLLDELKKGMEAPPPAVPRWAYPAAVAVGMVLIASVVIATRRRRKVKREAPVPVKPDAVPEVALEVSKAARTREHIEKLVRQNPEGVAQVLRTWLAEQK